MANKRKVMMVGLLAVILGGSTASALILNGIPGGDFSDPLFASGKPEEYIAGGHWTYYEGQANMPCSVVGTGADRHAEIAKEATWWNSSSIWYLDDGTTPANVAWKISSDLHGSYFTDQPMAFQLWDSNDVIRFELNFAGYTVTWTAGSTTGTFTSASGLDTTWRTAAIQYDPVTGEAKGTFGTETVFTATIEKGLTVQRVYFYVRPFANTGTMFIDNVMATALSVPKVMVKGTVKALGYNGDNTTMAIKFVLSPTGAGDNITQTVVLDANGGFSLIGIPEGDYTVTARGNCWMGTARSVTISGSDPYTISGDFQLKGGDVDGDNTVTSSDLAVLLANLDVSGS